MCGCGGVRGCQQSGQAGSERDGDKPRKRKIKYLIKRFRKMDLKKKMATTLPSKHRRCTFELTHVLRYHSCPTRDGGEGTAQTCVANSAMRSQAAPVKG